MATQLSRMLTMSSATVCHCAARLPNRPTTAIHSRRLVAVPAHGFRRLAAERRQAAGHRLLPLGRPFGERAASPGVRCLASKSDSSDKSWGEIASEAAQLGADLVKKVGSTVSKAVGAIVPTKEEEERVQRRDREQRRREDIYRPEDAFGGGLVGGLMGRAVGSMLRSAMGALGEQLREAQEQVADVQDRAASAIQASSRLRQRMGGEVRVGPAMSQSSSTSIINGQMSRNVTLIMPVVGPGGKTAQAQVQYVEGGSAQQQLGIVVQLPSGEVVELDGGSGPAGQVIDVDWRSVDDK